MFTFLLAARKPLAAIVATIAVVDIVVGSVLIATDMTNDGVFPKGIRFGFYRTDEVKG